MTSRMDESYFEEKKELAGGALKLAIEQASDAADVIAAATYALPDLTSPARVHELLRAAQLGLDAARRDFEKARWASSKTGLEFTDWLLKEGHADLFGG